MRKIYLLQIFALMLIGCTSQPTQKESDFAKYVNPFIGNADNGHTFPGACAPFGMIQVSPESGNGSWRYCSGFNYEDESILGFGQNHLNGTGCPDMGDILLLPFAGDIAGEYKSKINKETQTAVPGYYSVSLTDFDVDAELTATARTAFHRYTYNSDKTPHLLVDLQSGIVSSDTDLHTRVLSAEVDMPDNKTITGHNYVSVWVKRHIFFVIEFDKPYTIKEELPVKEGEKAKRLILSFDLKKRETLQVKVATSTVSVDGARAALAKENEAWDFDAIRQQTYDEWNKLLSRVEVDGTDDEKINFYTSMYHLYIQPNNIADVDGRYRGANDSVFTAPSGNYYSTFSLWDTYRAAHPLYTLLNPEMVDDFVNSMIAHHDVAGYLPVWGLWGKETNCMIGNHAIPVIVDAYLKGFRGFDAEDAFRAIKETSTLSHEKSSWDVYMKYGYYPFDLIKEESVARTLESSYDDYCAALLAKELGKEEDYAYFKNRSEFYKNLFDSTTKLMRGKDSKSKWRTPFNPFALSHSGSHGGDYTEGNAWQYTWSVQHDIESLIDMMGSKEIFAQQLDSLFLLNATPEQLGNVLDVTGLIGQYAHGNEPSHHVAYLYNYADKSYRTQEIIREVFDRFYLPKPNGLCGNDDCGQMSAWYIFSSMGFYPVNPVGGEYIIGAPQIKHIKFNLAEGKTFVIEAKNLSKENKYVQSVILNGQKLTDFRIHHRDIMKGGNLVFEMGSEPQSSLDKKKI